MSRRILLGLFLLALVACNGYPFSRRSATPTRQTPFSLTPSLSVTSTFAASQGEEKGQSVALEATSTLPQIVPLRIWLPPQFDPAADTPAGRLLRQRLKEFELQHPGAKIEVRLKAVNGPGGVLDTMTTASSAAPQALPDLVALPRSTLETAALKGLLRAYDPASLEDSDWYGYARQLANVENSIFGLPFAGDALIMVYRPSAAGSQPPRSWSDLLKLGLPLAFPVADPQALFPLMLYRSAGGALQDDRGHPMLDPKVLTQVFTFTLSAEQSGIMPNWLTLYDTYDQTWNIYAEGKTPLAVAWISRYLGALSDASIKTPSLPATPLSTTPLPPTPVMSEQAAALLPTPDGQPYIEATGWVWAIASPSPERQRLAVQLADFLTRGDFLTSWCPAAGYLPVRASALDGFQDQALRTLIGQLVSSARIYPSADLLATISPALEHSTLEAFKLQLDPASAAQQAAQLLASP